LSLIESSTKLEITGFGATNYKEYGWATDKELPVITSVNNAILFLKSEADIGLIDFNVTLAYVGTFSTHDDKECHFILTSKYQCLVSYKQLRQSNIEICL